MRLVSLYVADYQPSLTILKSTASHSLGLDVPNGLALSPLKTLDSAHDSQNVKYISEVESG